MSLLLSGKSCGVLSNPRVSLWKDHKGGPVLPSVCLRVGTGEGDVKPQVHVSVEKRWKRDFIL